MLPKRKHLVGSSNFCQICRRGQRIPSKHFTLFVGDLSFSEWQVAIVAGRKVGNAVIRNKLKRRLWHVAADLFTKKTLPNLGFVFIIKKSMSIASFIELQKDVDCALRRLVNRLNSLT